MRVSLLISSSENTLHPKLVEFFFHAPGESVGLYGPIGTLRLPRGGVRSHGDGGPCPLAKGSVAASGGRAAGFLA